MSRGTNDATNSSTLICVPIFRKKLQITADASTFTFSKSSSQRCVMTDRSEIFEKQLERK